MKDFIDYIETSLNDFPDTPILYRYKKKMLDIFTERANEITHAGLSDEKVICDLIRDEFSDLKSGYRSFEAEEKKKKHNSVMRKLIAANCAVLFLAMIFAYFAVSFASERWDLTWLIIVGGVFALTIFLLHFLIKRLFKMKKVFHPLGRLLAAGCVMLATVFTYLFCLMLVPMDHSWTIVTGGVALMFIIDGILARVTKQKFAFINYFIYIPVISTMLYVILGAYSVVSWNTGWLIIIGGIIVDLLIAIGIMINNSKYIYKQEAEDVWQEN